MALKKLCSAIILILLLSVSDFATADPLIMCLGRRVKMGDKYETVKKKCLSKIEFTIRSALVYGRKAEYKTIKTRFQDGT